MAKCETVCLGDVTEVITKGTTPTTLGFSFQDEGISFVKIESITEAGMFLQEKFEHISNECNEKLKRSQLKENDILFSIAGAIGRTALVTKEILPANTNQALAIIRLNDSSLLHDYVIYALKSDLIYKQFEKQKQGVAQLNISLKDVSDLKIPLPPLETQRQIAANLDKVTHTIDLCNAILEKLDLLVKSRFVEMFGDLANPDCKWDKRKLVDVCANPDDIKCGPFGTQLGKDEYTESGVAVWEIPQINSEFKSLPTHFITPEKAIALDSYSVKPGDIAMSRKGNVGRCAVFPDTFENGIIHSDVLRIRVDNNIVNPEFMMRQLHYSGDVQHQIEIVSSGAIMAGINVTKLKQIYVYIPPLALQEQFAAFVEQTDKSKLAVKQVLEKAETLKKALMQEYFG